MSNESPNQTPVHLWIVGVVSLLWNAMGAVDYVMTHTQNEGYLENFTPEQLEFLNAFPGWLVSFWAIAVWGGLLGSVLLLLRKSLAETLFAASFLSLLVTTVHNLGFAGGLEIMTTSGAIFSAAIFLVSLGLVFYARAMKSRGVLS